MSRMSLLFVSHIVSPVIASDFVRRGGPRFQRLRLGIIDLLQFVVIRTEKVSRDEDLQDTW